MRRVAALAATLILLAGCDNSDPAGQAPSAEVELAMDTRLYVQTIKVNGRTVSCVIFEAPGKGGVSCDFTREATP